MSVLDDPPLTPEELGHARLHILLAVIEHGPEVELAALVESIGGHPNGVRRHLDSLVALGLVDETAKRSGGTGRPAKKYSVSDTGRRVAAARNEGATQLELLTSITKAIGASGGLEKALEIGRAWGENDKRESTKETLEDQGFAPVAGDNDGEYILLSCPLRAAVAESRHVPCVLHQGFLEKALDTDVELIPFGDPRGCVVRFKVRDK